ncbi:MAG: membrane protein insertase YidC [bacterium]
MFFYKILFEDFTLTIIAVTLVVQLVLWPLSIKQYQAAKKMKFHQENLKKVQEKKASGKQLTVEESLMMSQALKSYCASCITPLIQLPFLMCLYDIINKVAQGKTAGFFNGIAYNSSLHFANDYKFNINFFGLDLSKTVFNIGFGNITSIILLALMIIATVIAQYYSMKISSPQLFEKKNKVQEIDASTESKKKKKNTVEKAKEPNMSDEIAKTSEQMTKVMTYVILAMSIVLPAALSVYWLARSIFVIILTKIQQKYIIKEK